MIIRFVFVLGMFFSQGFAKTKVLNEKEKLSYIMGRNLASTLKRQKVDLTLEYLFDGIRDGITGKPSILTAEEMRNILKKFHKTELKKNHDLASKNLKEGIAFLAKKAKEKGVVRLPSGLLYKVLKEGKGKTPKLDQSVTTHYAGTLIGGTEFDSSYKRGQPATFSVNRVIPGWTEALQLMKEGGKWQLFIPAKLAYGEKGVGGIGPNAALIFDIELISVN